MTVGGGICPAMDSENEKFTGAHGDPGEFMTGEYFSFPVVPLS